VTQVLLKFLAAKLRTQNLSIISVSKEIQVRDSIIQFLSDIFPKSILREDVSNINNAEKKTDTIFSLLLPNVYTSASVASDCISALYLYSYPVPVDKQALSVDSLALAIKWLKRIPFLLMKRSEILKVSEVFVPCVSPDEKLCRQPGTRLNKNCVF
jgi:hypothetical protein